MYQNRADPCHWQTQERAPRRGRRHSAVDPLRPPAEWQERQSSVFMQSKVIRSFRSYKKDLMKDVEPRETGRTDTEGRMETACLTEAEEVASQQTVCYLGQDILIIIG
jgi:hypothetical protein